MQRLLPKGGDGSGRLRVGLVYRESAGWAAQASFLHMFASSLHAVADESGLEVGIVSQRSEDGVCRVPQRLPGQRWFMLPAAGGRTALEATVEFHQLQVVVDLFGVPKATPGVGIVTWIPDFQSHRLPHLFTEQEHKDRHESYEQRAQVSQVILLSSHAAKADCEAFVPVAAKLAEVIPFPSAQAFTPFSQDHDPGEVLRHYHLPAKFILVANQYWAHKNHRAVLEALAIAASQGLRVPAVLTGLPSDYRDPANTPTSKLLQGIAELGLAGQAVPLGQVPFAHLVQLMRCAALVVQPSRFEGWSTVVQDIKALGRPLICSDISVHREQAPGALGFFSCDDPASLAALFREHWDRTPPGPDPELERRGLAAERVFARSHGLRAAELCHKAFALACHGTGA
jgi:glycosyltransferase involved in cell wall biosynthesis